MGQNFEEIRIPTKDTIYHSFDGEKILLGSGVRLNATQSFSGYPGVKDGEFILSQAGNEFKIREITGRSAEIGADIRMESPVIVTIKTIETFSDRHQAQISLAKKRREIEREPLDELYALVDSTRDAIKERSIKNLQNWDLLDLGHVATNLIHLGLAFEGSTVCHGMETWLTHPEKRQAMEKGFMGRMGIYPVEVKSEYHETCSVNGAKYPVIEYDYGTISYQMDTAPKCF